MARFARFVAAVLCIPFVWALCLSFLDAVCMASGKSETPLSAESVALLSGAVSFLALWKILPDQTRIYVFGHELTHAIWGIFFGARVSNIKVRPTGGSVTLSKSNVWITLSPYFFPFWTAVVAMLALAVHVIMHFAVPGAPFPLPWLWMFAVGFTWSFHACFTIRSLMETQPDIQEYGRLFSWTLILSCNVIGLLLWIACTTDRPAKVIFDRMFHHSLSAYSATFNALKECFRFLCDSIVSRSSL